MSTRTAWGFGLATITTHTAGIVGGTMLDVWYPAPALGVPADATAPAPADLEALGSRTRRGACAPSWCAR